MCRKTIFILMLLANSLFGQTGPGGVGSSASNVFWLDANSGITLVGSNVSAWIDRSGNTSNATPPSAAARPTIVNNNVNTFPSIDFDGTDDEFRITDKGSLDLTAWHFFIVCSVDLQKDYNAWIVKGNDGSENFEVLSYGTGADIGNIHTPILGSSRTFLNSPAGMVTTGNAFQIIEYSYSSAVGRDIYKNLGAQATDNDNQTPSVNNFDIYIGNERGTAGRFINGDIAEIIAYNAIQNPAGRIIINNYLSSKYNIALTGSDFYAGDTGANGDYDFEVGGIGRASAGNVNNSFSPSVSGGLGLTQVSGMNNGDYIFVGHNLKTNNFQIASDVGGMTGTDNARWTRIWYIDVTNGGAAFVTNVSFDMSDGGSTATPSVAANYVLLNRAGTSGNWTESTIVPTISGDVITFSNVTLADGYYTIGTKNKTTSPLPIELLSFTATKNNKVADIQWETATEINNDYYQVEKSKDGVNFESFNQVKGAGNSLSKLNYSIIDEKPYNGISYYRLKQVDFNGAFSYSKIESVDFNSSKDFSFDVYPNPNKGSKFNIAFEGTTNQEVLVVVYDVTGKESFSKVLITNENESSVFVIDPSNTLSSGIYFITATSNQEIYRKKLIVE
jgi:hypothetical protein